jgi:hypothetical protein
MEKDKATSGKTLARIEFTPEQRKIISDHAGRDIAAARIVELSPEQTRAIAPGLLKAAAIVMCW